MVVYTGENVACTGMRVGTKRGTFPHPLLMLEQFSGFVFIFFFLLLAVL